MIRRLSVCPLGPLAARLATLVVLAVGLGCLPRTSPATSPTAPLAPLEKTRSEASLALERIEAEVEAEALRSNLDERGMRGLPLEAMPDLSLDAARRAAELGAKILKELDAIPQDRLSSEELDSLGVLRFDAQAALEEVRYYWLELPVTPYNNQLRGIEQGLEQFPFAGPDDGERYLHLLGAYGRYITAIETKLRESARRGSWVPAPEIPVVAALFKAITAPPPEPFRVAPERLTKLPADLVARLPQAIEEEVRSQIAPAVAHLVAYLQGEYLEAAPKGVGLSQLTGGAEYYRWLVRQHTTLDLSPEEIHRTGLAEMERIHEEMEALRVAVHFADPLPAFRASLRSDPRYFAKTPEEVGAKLLAAQERMTPKIPQLFGRTPKAPYGVARLDPALEGSMTFGYYDPPRADRQRGLYFFNGSQLERRSTLIAAALIYHELAPGHHFQIALQRENEALPPFRRNRLPTAFVEGWGEYASGLAGEVALYQDPYDRIGRLMMESFLTARLVVDTGMNALGWTRQQAIDYMLANTLQSPEEIASETLRYSCDIPGQALAYKIGARTILELRRKTERELGAAFDIRRFHDEVLGGGALPLSVLAQRIDRFIAREKVAAKEAR